MDVIMDVNMDEVESQQQSNESEYEVESQQQSNESEYEVESQQQSNEFLENMKKYNFFDPQYEENNQPTAPETDSSNPNNLSKPSNQGVENKKEINKLNQPIEPETDSSNPNNLSESSNQGVENKKEINNETRKFGDDNIRAKIKNYFLLLVFTFLNNLICQQYGYQKMKFRKLKYKDIRNKEYNKKFLQKKFYEFILETNITSKFKTKDLELNKKHLKKLNLNDNSKVSNFLNMTMKFIYNNYFLSKKHVKNYFLNQKEEILNFDDCIKKLKKKNKDDYIEKFKKIAKEDYISYYFEEKNRKKKKIKFICKK
jgi:hypothetical protein